MIIAIPLLLFIHGGYAIICMEHEDCKLNCHSAQAIKRFQFIFHVDEIPQIWYMNYPVLRENATITVKKITRAFGNSYLCRPEIDSVRGVVTVLEIIRATPKTTIETDHRGAIVSFVCFMCTIVLFALIVKIRNYCGNRQEETAVE